MVAYIMHCRRQVSDQTSTLPVYLWHTTDQPQELCDETRTSAALWENQSSQTDVQIVFAPSHEIVWRDTPQERQLGTPSLRQLRRLPPVFPRKPPVPLPVHRHAEPTLRAMKSKSWAQPAVASSLRTKPRRSRRVAYWERNKKRE